MTVFVFYFNTACFVLFAQERAGGLRGGLIDTVAFECACLFVRSPISAFHRIVSSLMKAAFKCLRASLCQREGKNPLVI